MILPCLANDSQEAFDGALEALPYEDKLSKYCIWWDEDTAIYNSAWLADGQILRTSSAWYNRSCGDFENIIVVDSDLVAARQRPGQSSVISLQGAHNVAQVSRDANCESIWLPNCCGDAFRCRRD
jgi:hypothetical protein